jgi:hypothetical protein
MLHWLYFLNFACRFLQCFYHGLFFCFDFGHF